MSQRLTSSQLDFNPATFRYWGDVVVTIYDILYQRNPYARYFCLGLVKDAFAPGFDIMQGDKEHPRNEEILRDPNFNDMMEKVTMAIASRRAYGYSILAKLGFVKEGENATQEPVLYWLTYKDIVQLEIKEGTKEITKLEFHPPIYATTPGNLTPIVVEDKDLVNLKLLANYDKTMGLFRSEMEPIADTLIGLTNISQQTVVKQIRIGSGVRMIQAPWSTMSNADARKQLEKSLQNMGINSLLLVPSSGDGEGETKVTLNFGEGAIAGKEDRDMLVGDLASWTRVPVEIWLGSELGLKSSETNRKNYLNLMSKTESEEEETILQALEWDYDLEVTEVETVEPTEPIDTQTELIDTEQETEEISEPVDTHIWLRWNALEEKDEKEVIDALSVKFDVVLKLAQGEMMNKLGIDQEELYQLLGIELNIDESLKAKFEADKEELNKTMNSEETENGDTPDGDAEGEGSEGADTPDNNPEETD